MGVHRAKKLYSSVIKNLRKGFAKKLIQHLRSQIFGWSKQARRSVETPKPKNEKCGQSKARAAGQVGMREPKKKQGASLE